MPVLIVFLLLLLGCTTPADAQSPVPREAASRPQRIAGSDRLATWKCVRCNGKVTQGEGFVAARLLTAAQIPDGSPVLSTTVDAPTVSLPFATITYSRHGGVGSGYAAYLRAYAVDERGDTATARIAPIGEDVRATAYIPVDGLGRIREIGFLKTNGGSTYTRNARENFRVYGVGFAEAPAGKPGRGEPADAYLSRLIQEAKSGDVLDFSSDTFLLKGTVYLNGKRDITLRGGIFYTDEPRFNNRGNRDDFFLLRGARNVTLENVTVYGIRYGDYRLELQDGKSTTIPHWLSPHFEDGPTYRVDVRGTGRLTVAQGGEVLATAQVRDSAAVRFQLPDPLGRVTLTFDGGTAVVKPYGIVKHHYPSEFSSAFFVSKGCENVTLRNVAAYSIMGDGVQVGGDPRNTRIDGVYVNGASRQGASINGGTDTYLVNAELYNTGRAGLDIEPYGKNDRVVNPTVRNLRTGNHNFTSFIANNWGQITNLDLDGLESVGEMDATWLGGANGGTVRNVKGYGMAYMGANTMLENIQLNGTLAVRGGQRYKNYPDLFSGNNTVRDFTILRRSNSASSVLRADTTNTFINGLLKMADDYRIDSSPGSTPAYVRGGGKLVNVRVEDYERYFPNMILDGRKTQPLKQKPSLYGEFGSRFARKEEGGKLAPGTYFYQLTVVPRGQPPVVIGEKAVNVPKGMNALGIPIKGIVDQANGYVYHEIILKRGRSSGNYDTTYHIRGREPAGWNNVVGLSDLGDRLQIRGGNRTNNRFFGFPTQVKADRK